MSEQDQDGRTYQQLQHAMQSGVAAEHAKKSETMKDVRVGLNTALCDQAALVQLLEEKGIITREEYIDAITVEMGNEVRRYEQRLSRGGSKVTLA